MTILVTGATGNIGRMVVDHLLACGATDVRALTVDPVRAALPDGVDVARGHLRRLDTLPAALDGVDRLYLAPTPDTVTEVLALAREAGVARVVDLSGEPSSWWGSVSTAVEDCGLAWTHLWPGDFMENAWSWAPQVVASRTVREPWPEGPSWPGTSPTRSRRTGWSRTSPAVPRRRSRPGRGRTRRRSAGECVILSGVRGMMPPRANRGDDE